jgi:hypothetical protein
MNTALKIIALAFVLTAAPLAAVSQSTNGKMNKRPAPSPTPAAAATAEPTPVTDLPAGKRNERPAEKPKQTTKAASSSSVYFYTFNRPGFVYSHITIDFDEKGKGNISFQKSSFDEPIVDPIELSNSTVSKIKEALDALNFLDSTEEYQYERDYSHMGNIEIRVKRGGRERSVKYNWTENKFAKVLMDEFRFISNEYTWRFEIITSRENQPLLTPGLMDMIDDYLRRKEISDPQHLVPFLTELSNDERLPLMARNHAAKLIKQIGKEKK